MYLCIITLKYDLPPELKKDGTPKKKGNITHKTKNMKNLNTLTVADAIIILGIIRPTTNPENFKLIIDDKDYLIFRTDSFNAEEVCFNKSKDTNKTFEIHHPKESTNFDLIYLAYLKFIELGYVLHTVEKNKQL